MGRIYQNCRSALSAAGLLAALATPALAHSGERGQVLLLPTRYYIWGGGFAVLMSIVAVAFWAAPGAGRTAQVQSVLPAVPGRIGQLASFASFLLLAVLVFAGAKGPPDPVSNPLPGFVWGLFWLGMTALTLLAGNLWPVINPWRWLFALRPRPLPVMNYPGWFGSWPALIQFLVFAWVELVDPWANDPRHLATLCTIYLVYNGASAILYGPIWLERAEPFAAYFRMIGRLSPVQWNLAATAAPRLVWPGRAIIESPAPSASEAAFVIAALAAVSFDGFSHTFTWMGWLGLNPLDFDGRSAVVLPNTLGLLLLILVLAVAFSIAVRGVPAEDRTGLALTIIPIAIAYHAAHYLPDAPVIILRALKALSDPFGTGQDLIGTGHLSPPASVMNNYYAVRAIYRVQTACIVAGHVAAVVLAHLRLAQPGSPRGRALVAELPLNMLMVGYTLFGLWLLSTPTVA